MIGSPIGSMMSVTYSAEEACSKRSNAAKSALICSTRAKAFSEDGVSIGAPSVTTIPRQTMDATAANHPTGLGGHNSSTISHRLASSGRMSTAV